MSFTPYLESRVLRHFFKGDTISPAGTLYISLHTADPASGGNEVTASGYQRQSTGFTVSGSTASNADNITFNAQASYGTITHAGIWDSLSGGNMINSSALTGSRTIDAGEVASFAVSAIDVTLS